MTFRLRFLLPTFFFAWMGGAFLHAQTQPVQYSPHGGLYANPISVSLSCATPGATIRYTLDGSEPTAQSAIYPNSPLAFSSTAVLRARAYAPGLSPSAIGTHTYFIGISHTFPVVSLVFDHASFFDSLTGIYTNYAQDLTANANIEFFEKGIDKAVFNQLAEIEIQGTGSASQPQKSLEIKGKNSLGLGEFHYPLFPARPFEAYKRFVLRNSGQDWCVLQFRDAFATSLLLDRSDIGDILLPPRLYMQAWRPAVVYFNGQYWGIHNVRERMNRFYVRQHFNWEENEFDMIENYGDVSSGTADTWNHFQNYLQQTESGFENNSVFENLKKQIDYHNFLDYCVFNIYLENQDWPGNNVRRFRHRSESGKWRWLTYDLDFTFGLFQNPNGWNTGDPSPNALARLLDASSTEWPNPDWATLLFRRCWQNPAFRRDFANRLADMLNTAFVPQRVSQRLNEFRTLYQPEITRHFQRWWFDDFNTTWLDNIEKARYFALHRPDFARQEILIAMDEAYDLAELTVDVQPAGGGRVEVNTVRPAGAQFPWKGTYFKGVPLPLKAVANPGYEFVGWSSAALGSADSVGLMMTAPTYLVAHFQPTPVNVAEADTARVTIYPNPFREVLTVSGDVFKRGDFRVQLLDALGQVAGGETSVSHAAGMVLFNVAALPNGVYFLKITDNDGKETVSKVVKQ
ncbi:MAG: CotH kinase family protein [Saprospiraceae bacterium]|nr:CotH kinase family protein [Saprospiraceae bacterium]